MRAGTISRVTVVIVDDEELARRGITARLQRFEGWQVVGEFADGVSAVNGIRRLKPDVVFLDIQMPGMDGFEVIRKLSTDNPPAVVFLTAYDRHAVRAFAVQAIDYLLKPIDDERFEQTLARVRQRLSDQRAGHQQSALGRVRIAARDRGRVILLDAEVIDWVEADDDYVRLHTAGRQYLIRETLRSIEERLPPMHFVRIHRSAIVNVRRVREILPQVNREAIVVLDDGTRLKLSRNYRDRLGALTRNAR
jgi:two-component system LytT family response regulator